MKWRCHFEDPTSPDIYRTEHIVRYEFYREVTLINPLSMFIEIASTSAIANAFTRDNISRIF